MPNTHWTPLSMRTWTLIQSQVESRWHHNNNAAKDLEAQYKVMQHKAFWDDKNTHTINNETIIPQCTVTCNI